MTSTQNRISHQYSKLVRLTIMGILAIVGLFPSPVLGDSPTATVGVYYFEGWYHDTPGAIAAFANDELRNDFPEREPIWGGGLWRGDTVEIMEQQIDLAADHGITFFSFDWYWYGSQEATENDGINSGLKHFMLASNRNRMKFNINIVDAAPTTIDSDAEWEQVADMLLPYLNDSQYLRINGNPLITNFNAAGMTQTNYDYFQQIAQAAGITEVVFAANVAGSASLYKYVTRYNAVLGWGGGEVEYPYQSLTEYVEGNDDWAPGVWNTDSDGMAATQSYIPMVMSGWDARPWDTPPSWYFNNPALGHTPDAFAAHLQKALDWIDDNPTLATAERLVMVYAWNEFGEGGYIAPTVGDPDGLYLDALKSVVLVPDPDILFSQTVAADYSLVSMPLDGTGITDAQGLAQAIPNCTAVWGWDAVTQSWSGHPLGGPNNFAVEPGGAYVVSATGAGTFQCSGTWATPAFDLKAGYNLISLPKAKEDITTAEDLAQDIPDCTAIWQWDSASQTWSGHPLGGPNNFAVEVGGAYLISVTTAGSWP